MFYSGGYGKLKEKEAFEYLKSLVGTVNINFPEIKANIKFTPNQEFALGDWSKWKTSIWDEIEVSEQEAQELQQCTNSQHQQLEKQVKDLQAQLNAIITGVPRTAENQMEAKVQQTNLPPGEK